MHQNRFRLALRPRPSGEAYSAPSDPLAGFKGPTFKERVGKKRGREGKGRVKERGDGRGREVKGPALRWPWP